MVGGGLRSAGGRPFAANWAHFSARGDLGDPDRFRSELSETFRALFDDRLEIHEDVVTTMRELAGRGIALAVVSSSTRDHIERVLERAQVSGLAAAIVASGDTAAHKPDPAPYLRACALLDAAPARTVGVEDTPTGARSSRAAGLRTVAVRRAHAVPELAEHADLVVEHLRIAHLEIPTSTEPHTGGRGSRRG